MSLKITSKKKSKLKKVKLVTKVELNTVSIPVIYLSAISLFASKYDVRSCLNGVAINNNYLVATDGVSLAAIPVTESIKDVCIPIKSITSFLKLLTSKQKTYGDILINLDSNYLNCDNIKMGFHPIIDSEFPRWKSIVSSRNLKIHLTKCFNWNHLVKFQRAGKILTNSDIIYLEPHGIKSATVIMPSMKEFIGVITPIY